MPLSLSTWPHSFSLSFFRIPQACSSSIDCCPKKRACHSLFLILAVFYNRQQSLKIPTITHMTVLFCFYQSLLTNATIFVRGRNRRRPSCVVLYSAGAELPVLDGRFILSRRSTGQILSPPCMCAGDEGVDGRIILKMILQE
jgi:hypothetical protein